MSKFINPFPDVASLNQKERDAYDENLRKYRDTIAVMEGQYLEGMEKANAENARKTKENARKMKEDGMSVELIIRYTGLSAEEIAKL